DPVEGILAEALLLDLVLQVAVGRGDDPRVERDLRVAADRAGGALLQRAQELGLHAHGHLGDLVEEERRVLPGLQAAFIDIGLERAAFLHVEDLIRPDDFETYLAGGRKHALGTGTSENGQETPDEADEVKA